MLDLLSYLHPTIPQEDPDDVRTDIASFLPNIVIDNAKSPVFSQTRASAQNTSMPGLVRHPLKDVAIAPCRWNAVNSKSEEYLRISSQQALKMPVRISSPSKRKKRINSNNSLKMPVRSLDKDDHDWT